MLDPAAGSRSRPSTTTATCVSLSSSQKFGMALLFVCGLLHLGAGHATRGANMDCVLNLTSAPTVQQALAKCEACNV
eukprot:364821-Chlamydomonas_euryale.AAC.4